MAEDDHDAPITEPVVALDLFATGAQIEPVEGNVRIVAWVDVPRIDGVDKERRIVGRLVFPGAAARELLRDLRKVLSGGGN